jgi:hypothetical protein
MATKRKKTRKPTTSKLQYVPVVTKRQLIEAQSSAQRWDFNRQIHPKLDLTALGDFKYPVTFFMLHDYRRMQPCEEHVRILVFIPEFAWWREIDTALLTDPHHLLFDVPAEFFAKLKGSYEPLAA